MPWNPIPDGALTPILAGLAGLAVGPLLNAVSLWVQDRAVAGSSRRRLAGFMAGAALVAIAAALGRTDPLAAAAGALLGWQLMVLAAVDTERFWLPDILTAPLALTGLAAAWATGSPGIVDAVMGGVVGFAGLWLIGAIYKKVRGRQGLGGGDPFLLGAGGVWIGWTALPTALIWASAAGISVVLARALTGGKVRGDDRLPFGVFLAVGIFFAWLFGPLGF